MTDNSNASRKYILSGIAVSIFIVYIIQIFSLQITNDDFKNLGSCSLWEKDAL